MTTAKPDENWFHQKIYKLLDSLSRNIKGRLCQYNIDSEYTHEDIKNDVFLLVQKLINFGKLEPHLDVDGELYLVRIKGGSKERIINPRAWLRKVAFNYVRGLHRKHKRFSDISSERWASLLSTEQSNVISFSRQTHPIQYVENLELRDKIRQLPNEDSAILNLFYFEKLSCVEISIRLESKGYPRYTEENIRQKKHRALNKIRRLYL